MGQPTVFRSTADGGDYYTDHRLLLLVSQTQGIADDEAKPQVSVRISADRVRYLPGADVKIQVRIRNESDQDLFIFKEISEISNALATIQLRLYQGSEAVGPIMMTVSDTFSSERPTYPPLVTELPPYWIALPPGHFYGGELVIHLFTFKGLKAPGKYRIQGSYRSRGFLAEDINNPLLHYAEELKRLPYKAWVGEVKTNSIWIELTNSP